MEEYWKPDFAHHGSYFLGWTSTQEARWKQSYRVWMDALREFGTKGGLIATGDDAGFIYSLYGFGLLRELELMEEAGFHPLEVIRNATVNGAKLLGLGDRLGRVRAGYVADLLVVNGNPLDNLHLLNPYGDGDPDAQRPAGLELRLARSRRPRAEGRAGRRDRVDHQGRHPVPRARADERGKGDGSGGSGTTGDRQNEVGARTEK